MADKDFKVKSGLDLGTPLPLTEGGTGQTSASNALNALLPVQTSNTSKFLQTDGTSTSWVAAAVANNATFTGSSMVIPSGTNAERPASPVTGAIRLNTDQGTLEFWTGTSWGAIATFPQPPRNLVATDVGTSRAFNNASASVAFDLPTGNGGSTITSYKITSSPGGYNATGSSSPVVVTGLQSNTSYTFTGTATNSIGEGASSVASSSILATTIPEVPTIGTATNQPSGRAYNNGQASITFTPNATGGKSNTYTITSSPGGFTGTGSSSPILVTGLQSNTGYTFTATATNANGTTAASSATSSITSTTVPQAPTIGTPSSSGISGQISVPFTTNATGGSAITGYTVTSNPGSITGTGSSPITVSGLTNGTSYTFTVTATNANGTSAASSSSSSVSPRSAASVSGGTFSTDGTYNYRTFTTNGTLGTSGGTINFDVVLVAGGAGGGSTYGGGGGAGGLVYSSANISPGSYAITIGGAGPGAQTIEQLPTVQNGTNSTMTGKTTAVGGGGGGNGWIGPGGGGSPDWSYPRGAAGGSGGGGNYSYSASGGAGTAGQGNAGAQTAGFGGGGGGAGAAGSGNGTGGAGLTYFGTGYAGGGGGGSNPVRAAALGGGGLGGNYDTSVSPTAGTTNRGGGGGGGGNPGAGVNGANGGSGICVVRYLVSQTA